MALREVKAWLGAGGGDKGLREAAWEVGEAGAGIGASEVGESGGGALAGPEVTGVSW